MGEIEKNLLTSFFLLGMVTGAVISLIVSAILERKNDDSDY
jgi:hypothetical protein